MAGSDPFALNSTFDPFSQNFTLLMPDGVTVLQTELGAINMFVNTAVQATIVQAIQVGLVAMLAFVLLLITKPEKRRSVVFIINALALVIIFIRGVVDLIVLQGPLYSFYRWETHYYVELGHAPALASADQVFAFLSTFAIEAALVVQLRIVCCTLPTFQRLMVNGLNVAVALVASVCHFTLSILNIRWNILGVDSERPWQFETLGRLDSATYTAITISIGLSSLIFTTKLAFAIRTRHSLGMTQFGAMQIIFVGGCQTMIVPFVFTVLSYFAFPNANLQTFVQTTVAVLLPLSGMWAATATTSNVNIAKPSRSKSHPVSGSGSGGRHVDAEPKIFDGSPQSYSAHTCSTLIGGDSPKTPGVSETSCEATDQEMQRMSGVVIDRTFSVLSG